MKLVKLREDPIEKVYVGLVDEAITEVRGFRKPARRFRASEVHHCRRQLWYRLAGFTPAPKEPWLSLVADSGNFHHDYARQTMVHFGVDLTGFQIEAGGAVTEDRYVVREFEFDRQTFSIAARADAGILLDVPGAAEPVLATVEIKSVGHFAFEKLQSAFKSGGEEKLFERIQEESIGYVWQGNATAMVREVEYVWLVLVGRNSNSLGVSDAGWSEPGEWDPLKGRRIAGPVWRVEEQDRGNILQKLADVDRALDNGDPPAPDFTDGSKDCRQCPFWYACWGKRKRAAYPIPGVVG